MLGEKGYSDRCIQFNEEAMSKNSIGRSSFWGMVAVAWLSILVLGGTWGGVMFYEFHQDSEGLRADFYERQKEVVKSEVEKGLALVHEVRREWVEEFKLELHNRAERIFGMVDALGRVPNLPRTELIQTVVESVRARDDVGVVDLFSDAVNGDTLLLLAPNAEVVDMARLRTMIMGAGEGGRQISLVGSDGKDYTYIISIRSIESAGLTIVSGGCLEAAESSLKAEVVHQLEMVRFGSNGYLFGGTWQGESVVGPAKGGNMWQTTDANGVKIVQELISAAKKGGGFVAYVLPKFEGRRSTDKISYAMPLEDWQWYIGAGQYVDEIESVIEKNRERLVRDLLHQIELIVIVLGALSVLAYIVSRRISKRMEQNVAAFSDVWNRASYEGGELDPDALHYSEFRELAVIANRMLVAKQTANEKMRDSAEQFSTLARSIHGIIFRCAADKSWTMQYVSQSIEEITGYPASDFIKNKVRSYHDIIDLRDRSWVNDVITEAVEERKPYSVEYRVNRLDGETIWAFEKGQARYDQSGNVISIDGVILDVTERKDAQKERFRHIHYLETLEQVEQVIRRNNDVQNMLWDVMETIRRAFGADRSWLLHPLDIDAPTFKVPIERTSEEYPGANAMDMDVAIDAATRNVFQLALDTDESVAFDPSTGHPLPPETAKYFGVQSQLIIGLHPRTSDPWLMGLHQCSSARVWGDDERQLFKEVSRRVSDALSNMLILEELQESEERFRTFSEQTMLGLAVVQGNRVVFANQAFCDIFETTVDEMLALPPAGFLKYVHPDDQEFLMEQGRKKQAGDPDVVPSYEWRAITDKGRVRVVRIHSKTVSLNGSLADLISLTDITDLHRSHAQLEDLVQERTADLAIKASELEEANKRLLRLDELKSSFVTTVSHDLRTPLTSVLGYAKLVRRDLDNKLPTLESGAEMEQLQKRISNNLGIMASEGERLTLLIDEFMDLTAMEAGTATWYDEVTDMAECITQAVKQARIRAMGKPAIEVELDIQGELPAMTLDAIRFKQVLANLLDNAIQFSEDGMITVFVESPDGVGLTLSVTDQGKGIPESELEAIFEPFHQVETSDTLVDEIKGSGLGLALSLGIIQNYGGSIKVDSLPGKGSTFTVELPGNPVS